MMNWNQGTWLAALLCMIMAAGAAGAQGDSAARRTMIDRLLNPFRVEFFLIVDGERRIGDGRELGDQHCARRRNLRLGDGSGVLRLRGKTRRKDQGDREADRTFAPSMTGSALRRVHRAVGPEMVVPAKSKPRTFSVTFPGA